MSVSGEFLLRQWVVWSHDKSGQPGGYPSSTPFRQQLGGSRELSTLNDGEAQVIDAVMSRIRKQRPDLVRIALVFSECDGNVSRTARKLSLTRGQVERKVNEIVAMLDGAMIALAN